MTTLDFLLITLLGHKNDPVSILWILKWNSAWNFFTMTDDKALVEQLLFDVAVSIFPRSQHNKHVCIQSGSIDAVAAYVSC